MVDAPLVCVWHGCKGCSLCFIGTVRFGLPRSQVPELHVLLQHARIVWRCLRALQLLLADGLIGTGHACKCVTSHTLVLSVRDHPLHTLCHDATVLRGLNASPIAYLGWSCAFPGLWEAAGALCRVLHLQPRPERWLPRGRHSLRPCTWSTSQAVPSTLCWRAGACAVCQKGCGAQ